jgi:manganese/zinc/iron transport system ATP- binding protein
MNDAAALAGTVASPLEVLGLSAGYTRGDPVVRDISFSLVRGSMTALIGPNGGGKSTLLRALLGLVPFVESTRVAFFGEAFDAVRPRVAYVPQRAQIDWDFPASAFDVVLMGCAARVGLFGRVSQAHRDAAQTALTAVGLESAANVQIGALSGGQRQRVLVARAFAQNAQLLLLDEPFANVDTFSEARLSEALRGLCARGSTVLAVHHNLHGVRTHFDEAILLRGTIMAAGSVHAVMTDARLSATYGLTEEPAR